MTTSSKFQLPTIFVIFGITGDLVKKKILRSIYSLYLKELVPKRFQVIGFARKPYTDETIRDYLREIMVNDSFPQSEKYDEFLNAFFYVQGEFHSADAYNNLAASLGRVDDHWNICTNKLFYLAVPPRNYREILENIHASGLTIPCSPEEGWTRVILEKPFGTDLTAAEELDALLGQLFKEEQIYRVDHYLAKETVRNILAFRFSNSILTPAWNNQHIEKIEIKLLEGNTVSTRGEFYDKVGALRDVGQNHMLQLLALFTMENPGAFTAEHIRRKRAVALAQLRIFSQEEVWANTVRGQYEGYKEAKGVDPNSTTETYFKMKAFIDNDQFRGVPIYMESGKGFSQSKTEIIFTFKHPEPCLCPHEQHFQNTLHYYIQPEEKFTVSFLVKKPGYDYSIIKKYFEFDYGKLYEESEFIEAYEQLLLDIIRGDQTLFVSTEEILSQWRFVEPIEKVWEETRKPEIFSYEVGKEQLDIVINS